MTQKQFRAWLKVRLSNLANRTSLMARPKVYRSKPEDLILDLELLVKGAKDRKKLIK